MKGVFVFAAVVVLASSQASIQAAIPRPALRLMDANPVTVRGTSFKPRELIRVTFTVGVRKIVRSVRATRIGRFTSSAGEEVSFDRCGDFFRVIAVGSRGSRASLKYPQPECPPSP